MKFISRKTKFSTVTKKERIEQVNVKSEDEANKVLGDYLLGKGITIETLTRVVCSLIELEQYNVNIISREGYMEVYQ